MTQDLSQAYFDAMCYDRNDWTWVGDYYVFTGEIRYPCYVALPFVRWSVRIVDGLGYGLFQANPLTTQEWPVQRGDTVHVNDSHPDRIASEYVYPDIEQAKRQIERLVEEWTNKGFWGEVGVIEQPFTPAQPEPEPAESRCIKVEVESCSAHSYSHESCGYPQQQLDTATGEWVDCVPRILDAKLITDPHGNDPTYVEMRYIVGWYTKG